MNYEHDIDGVKVPYDMCAAFAYAYQERFGGVPGGIAHGLAGVIKWQAEQAAAHETTPEGAGMSELFDPEKIERWDCEASGNVVEASDGQYIRAADYDKLLALYREAARHISCELCGSPIWLVAASPEPLWSHYGNNEDGEMDHSAAP